jgi:hypothetical protein
MLDYFEYEQIIESYPVDVRKNILDGKNYLIPAQPHGVLSFCGICSAVNGPEFMPLFKSAVASAVALHANHQACNGPVWALRCIEGKFKEES